jgi:N-succinyldiaminopimelate aminotransferase
MSAFLAAERVRGFGTSIFTEMSALAVEHKAVNLGQGFPDFAGPAWVKQAAAEAIAADLNQYALATGLPRLRAAIAATWVRNGWGDIDPSNEVTVTSGATEALFCAAMAFVNPGDEVICFEPFYDAYLPDIIMAGGVPRVVRLYPPAPTDNERRTVTAQWRFDPDELAAAFTPRTRIFLLNTPHNPTGKVFTREELALVAELAIEHDLVVVADEVYEHLVFDGRQHVPIATLPGMAERTLTISSGGKTFNTTGWKIGWMCGPEPIVTAARTAKQFLTYVNGAPFQPAIAVGLGLADSYFTGLAADLQAKRDRLGEGLAAAGFTVYRPEATYFTTVDITPVEPSGDGMAFCRELPSRCGVVAIPNEVFYADPAAGRHLVRFACCKQMAVIDDAVERLRKLAA